MKKKEIIILAIALIIIIGFVLITSISNKPTAEINVGVIVPLTGNTASFGEDCKNGINLAYEDSNRTNVHLIFEDSKGTKEGTLSAFQKLSTTNNISIAIGEISGSNTLPITDLAQSNKILLLAPLSTHKNTTDAGDYVFKFNEDVEKQVTFISSHLYNDLNISKVAVIYSTTNETLVIAKDTFENDSMLHNKKITTIESFKDGDTDFKTQLLRIKSSGADALVLLGFPVEGALILKQAKELDLNIFVIGLSVLNNPEVFKLGGENATNGLNIVSISFSCNDENTITGAYCKEYKAKYKMDPRYQGGYCYDTLKIVLDIMKTENTTNVEIIKNKLKYIDYNGVSGEIKFDINRNVYGKSYVLKIAMNGKFVDANK